MRKIYLVILLLTIGGNAQIETQFSGYLLNLPVYQHSPRIIPGGQQDLYLNLTRLRLRPTLYFGDNSRLTMEYEITSLVRSGPFLFSQPPGKSSRQTFDLRWAPLTEDKVGMLHFIDRLYFRRDFQFGNITIGRQRVAWGTGRIWNPTDLFNPLNPASFEKIEKDGADLIAAKLYLGSFTDLTVVYNPQKNLSENNGGFRFRSNYASYDLSLVGGYFDDRVVIGGDFAGNLLLAGVRGEGIFSAARNNFDDQYLNFILGLDYQFTAEIYALVEYQYNGRGSRSKNNYDLPALINNEIINLARNYIFLQTSLQIHPLVSSSLAWNGNLDDHSGFALGTLTYSFRENVDLSIGGLLSYGNRLDEYWYYPNSIFFQGTFYF